MRKSTVYLAGKISPRDWRSDITNDGRVGGLADNGGDPIEHLFDPSYREEYDTFLYGGPYFISCDHRCAHVPGMHANASVCGSEPPDHTAVLKVNTERILRADWMFTFINETDCYGTLIELGIALRQDKPRVVVAFGPNVTEDQRGELWMAAHSTEHVYEGLPVKDAWRAFTQTFLSPRPHRDDRRITPGFFFTGGGGYTINYTIPAFDFSDLARLRGDEVHAGHRWLDIATSCAANLDRIPAEHHGFLHGVADRLDDRKTITGRQGKYLGRLFHQYILGTS